MRLLFGERDRQPGRGPDILTLGDMDKPALMERSPRASIRPNHAVFMKIGTS